MHECAKDTPQHITSLYLHLDVVVGQRHTNAANVTVAQLKWCAGSQAASLLLNCRRLGGGLNYIKALLSQCLEQRDKKQ